jgi:hypothetical protein
MITEDQTGVIDFLAARRPHTRARRLSELTRTHPSSFSRVPGRTN